MGDTGLTGLFFPEASGRFRLPLAAYYIARTAHALTPLFLSLSKLETRSASRWTRKIAIERPIYICGLARAGTTAVLQMLSQHPHVASHRYIHMPMPYLPYWWGGPSAKSRITTTRPVERLHGDGIMVGRYSPEAVEEALWIAFFEGLHEEGHSNVLDGNVSNEAFEVFYQAHIRKLLARQGRSRYIAKNNYNISRMEYLLGVFPDARFLFIVRKPADHVASILRQNRIFENVENTDPRMAKMMQLVGHYEFGKRRVCINVGDADLIRKVRRLWSGGKEVQGWAHYWAAVHNFVADGLERSSALAQATLVVKQEDLTRDSLGTLDRIIDHVQLSAEAFAPIRIRYALERRERTRHSSNFSAHELVDIAQITAPTAARWGYVS